MMLHIKFNIVKFLIIVFVVVALFSCENGINNQPSTAKGFQNIEKELKSKFGNNAFYTDLSITYNNTIGNIVSVTVSVVPELLKMEQWNNSQSTWKQNQAISIEVPNGSKVTDFMFQLNDKINLSKLGRLVEASITELTANKGIENPRLYMALIKFPKNGDQSKTEYVVILKPEKEETIFSFSYNIDTELIKMNY